MQRKGQMQRIGKWLTWVFVGFLVSCVVATGVPGVRAAQPDGSGVLVAQADALQQALELNERAFELYNAGRYVEAEPLYKQSLEIWRSQLGNNHPNVATSLNNLASLYQAQGRYTDTEPLLEQSLEIRRSQLGTNHPDVAQSLNNLAGLYLIQGRYTNAEPLLKQALEIFRSQFGSNHPNVATGLNNLASLYQNQGRYADAERLHRQSLEIRRSRLGDNHPDVAQSLINLAELYRDQGRYTDAEPLYEQALEIERSQLGRNHPYVATSLNNLASLYRTQGRYAEAEPLLKQSLDIRRSQLGDNHPDVATSLNNLALLYQAQGRYAGAEPLYEQSLDIRRLQLGDNHPDVAASLNNLATLYQAQGRYAEAEPLYEQALEIVRLQLGPNHPDVAASLNNLAGLYRDQGRYAEAELLYEQALEIVRLQFSDNHPNVATSLDNLSSLYLTQGRYAESEPLYERALDIRRSQFSGNHPNVATSLNNLALLYGAQSRYAESEPLLEQSLEIWRSQLGPNHPAVATSLNNLAALYQAQGNLTKAMERLREGLDIEETHLDLNLAVLAPDQRRNYISTISGTTNQAISLHLQAAPDSNAAATLALTTLLRRKGRILEASTSALQTLRRNLETEDQETLDALTAVHRQLSALLFAPSELLGDITDYRATLAQLETEANSLETTLTRRAASYRAIIEPTEISTVQAQIPTDSALIEYIRYRPVDLTAAPTESLGSAHYGAYLLFPNGTITALDLGLAEPIDAATRHLSATLADRRSTLNDNRRAATDLYDRIFAPLAPHLEQTDHLLISPDGDLNLIPFQVLQDPQGRHLIQDFKISYLNAGRELQRLGSIPPSTNPPVILADPAYDSQSTVASSANTRSVDLQTLTANRLPWTAKEGEQIAALLPDATLRTGPDATETFLKQVQSPQLLHIATHGIFLPPPSIWQRFNPETNRLDEIPGENPLLRAMLALAGFNPPRSSGEDDGVFTALEASQLNLFGTQLVVLSACDTGQGEVANGDGVYGLRRAFSLAGAESLLMSLWRVEDQGTQELMTRYYQLLLDGLGRSDALRQIQLDMIEAGESPYRWAAFVLAGNWLPLGEQPTPTRQQSFPLWAIALGTISFGLVLITFRSLKPKGKRKRSS